MIDIHIHLLPGVDDGPETLEESVEMCRAALASGCDALIATPHQRREWSNQDPESLRRLLRRVQEAVGSSPRLYLGAEVRVDSGLLEELEADEHTGLLGLGGSRYLLVEFSDASDAAEIEGFVHEASLMGFRPVVAHPEFVPALASEPGLVRRLVDRGAMMQVTAMTVTGQAGRSLQRVVHRLIDAELVHFVASDAHSMEWRPPGLREAQSAIGERWGQEVALRLTETNARAVVASEPVPTN